MSAIIIDGKAVSARIRLTISERAEKLKERGIFPCLAVVIVGTHPASVSYVKGTLKNLQTSGMEGREIRLPETITESEMLAQIAALNADEKIHGILIQLPLPPHIREEEVINAMDPRKDLDCFHPVSLGKLLLGQPGFLPCTPHGVITLLSELQIPVSGKHVVVVGRSNIVGKPLALLLARRETNATVTICHTGTNDIARFTRQADILIAAAGKPALIKGDMIKEGAVVIDVGVNQIPGTKNLCGDVDYSQAVETAGWITPVPGGVGPMTTAMLMQNLVSAAEKADK